MTANSNIVLLWTIDNATTTLATGRAESGVINEGGYQWVAAAQKRSDSWAEFSLRCSIDKRKCWRCAVKMDIWVIRDNGVPVNFGSKGLHAFNANNSISVVQSVWYWSYMEILARSRQVNTMTVEFRLKIFSSERGSSIADPGIFAAPNPRSSVILKIGDQKLHVSKEMLAIYSPVFDILFFGDFAENGKEEVELKDIDYEEFLDLLNLVYGRKPEITDSTVLHILKLADRFQMECVLNQSERFLILSTRFDVVEKLLLADQYRLTSLKDHCLMSFTNSGEMIETLKPALEQFSGEMKIACWERVSKI